MKKIFLIASIALSTFICFSQTSELNIDNITWGNLEKIKKHLEPILIGEVGEELIFVNNFHNKITFQKYNKNSLLLTKSETIEFKNPQEQYVNTAIINEQPYVFTSFYDRVKTISYTYSQKLDVNNLNISEQKVIIEYDFNLVKKVELTKAEKKELRAKLKREIMQQVSLDMSQDQSIATPKTILNLYTSTDNSFTFLNYGNITKQNQFENQSALTGKLLDNNLNELNTFEYNIPFTEFEIIETKVNNNGKAFILINKLKFHNKTFNEMLYEHDIESTHLLVIDLIDGESELINTVLEDRFFSEVTMKTLKNGGLIIAGLTSKNGEIGVDELYSISYDKDMNETKVSQTAIEKKFIVDGWSDREKLDFEKVNKKNIRKGINEKSPQLYNYYINDILELSDGSVTVLAEQYIKNSTNTGINSGSSRGANPGTNLYGYNDIIAIHYDYSGEYQWIKRIEKRQKSLNDYGEYSSYFVIQNDDFIEIIYNEKIKPVKIQLNSDGSIKKESFIEFTEKRTVLLPKKCKMINDKEFLLYTIGKSGDKIGILKL